MTKRRTIVEDLSGVRHEVDYHLPSDPRIIITKCGIRVAWGGIGHPHPTPCEKEK